MDLKVLGSILLESTYRNFTGLLSWYLSQMPTMKYKQPFIVYNIAGIIKQHMMLLLQQAQKLRNRNWVTTQRKQNKKKSRRQNYLFICQTISPNSKLENYQIIYSDMNELSDWIVVTVLVSWTTWTLVRPTPTS